MITQNKTRRKYANRKLKTTSVVRVLEWTFAFRLLLWHIWPPSAIIVMTSDNLNQAGITWSHRAVHVAVQMEICLNDNGLASS